MSGDYMLSDPVRRKQLEDQLARNRERFAQIQERDGLPCPDTGIGHCSDCHVAITIEAWPDSPTCGHTFGCPEC